MDYEAPAVTAVSEIGEPLIGAPNSVPNPQWRDETDAS